MPQLLDRQPGTLPSDSNTSPHSFGNPANAIINIAACARSVCARGRFDLKSLNLKLLLNSPRFWQIRDAEITNVPFMASAGGMQC